MSENINPIDALYDENNCDNIILCNEKGKLIEFEQIALIPQGEHTYAILKPVKPMEGVGEDEGLVFSIDTAEEDGKEFLRLVTDEAVIDSVFDVYDALWAAENEE